MAFTFLCPTCVGLSLTSTVTVEEVKKDFVITRGSFATDGSVVPPVVKQRIVTLCSNGHRVNNDVNNIPDDLLTKLTFFLP